MRFICSLFFLIFTLSFNSTQAQDRTVAGVEFPSKVTAGTNLLTYNGAGLREKFFIDLYVSALYLKETSMNAKKIVDSDQAMAIRMELVSDKVTRDKFVETVEDGFETATAGKATASDISKLKELFSDPFSSGDIIKLAYVPDEGVQIHKNSTKLGTISGLEFKKALFSIWFGDKPADSGLKEDMLGKV